MEQTKEKMRSKVLLILGCLFVNVCGAYAQDITVKGNVKDATGEPLIGATVNVQSVSSLRTITDIDGNFTISVPKRIPKQILPTI